MGVMELSKTTESCDADMRALLESGSGELQPSPSISGSPHATGLWGRTPETASHAPV